jgi:hypothetical protein
MTAKAPRSTWFLLIGVLAVIAAGCGGEDSLSEEDFLAQFDEICLEVSDDIQAIGEPATTEELAEQAGEAVDIASQGVEDLSELSPPEDLQDTVDELLEVLEQRVELFEDLQAAAEDDDNDAIESLAEDNAELESEVDGLGEDLGLECFVDDAGASGEPTSDVSDQLTSDFSDDVTRDFSDDFSSDVPTDASPGAPPAEAITEYGSDPALDALADACFDGDFAACDTLYQQSASGSGYEAYGDTCAARQDLGTGQFCVDTFG